MKEKIKQIVSIKACAMNALRIRSLIINMNIRTSKYVRVLKMYPVSRRFLEFTKRFCFFFKKKTARHFRLTFMN